MKALILTIAVAVLFCGCISTDLVSRHTGPPPVCEVHGAQMHPEWIHVSTGNIVYAIEYLDVVKTNFPHHGGVILSGEREFQQPINRRVRDFVCPDCDKAFHEYWRNRSQANLKQ